MFDTKGKHEAGLLILEKRRGTKGWYTRQCRLHFGHCEDRCVRTGEREREKRGMLGVSEMTYEGSLTRAAETVTEQYGQLCGRHRIVSHQGCLLTDREVCRRERWESEMATLSFLAVSTDGLWRGLQFTEKTQEDHFPDRGESKCMSLT